VPAAHGSDGLGSIRIPAAACGLVGLKPTHGLLPLEPDPEHWQGLSHTGVLTRTVEDTALLLDVLAGGAAPGLHAGLAQRRPLRIAWSVRAPAPARVHPEVRNALDATVERLRSLGHDVRQADPPYGELVHVMMPRYLRGAAEDLAGLVDPGATERRTRAMARLGRLLPDSLLRRAHRDGSAATARLEEFFSRTDVLLTPATAGLPIRADRLRTAGVTRTLTVLAGWVPFTQAWNITGQPALVVPAGMSSSGLPLAVQLVARRGADSTLLALGAALEELTGWAQTRPALEGPGR
ncbi:MAG TPA: amidase family protein, partial [Mycobacteriales bacterium]|nr:amidase family protein [Mycobacteriales bacterium]